MVPAAGVAVDSEGWANWEAAEVESWRATVPRGRARRAVVRIMMGERGAEARG